MIKSDNDLEFIKGFSKISVKDICDKKKVNRSNLLAGRSTKDNSKKVKKGIEAEIYKLYIKSLKESGEENEEIKENMEN